MTGDKMVSITITEKEASSFALFRQYQSIWEAIFNEMPKSKKIELHFDNRGLLEFAETNKRFYNSGI